jgi:Domain of unknown function (DUF4234)
MATEVQIAGSPAKAKIRSPWAAALLPIVTIGIYFFFWYYYINREMSELGKARGEDLGDSPGKSVLAVTLGALIIVPAIISLVHTGQRLQKAQTIGGVDPTMNGWLALVMYLIFSPVMFAYWQSELNKVWTRVGDAPQLSGGEAAAATTGDSMGPGATTPSQSAPSDATPAAGQPGGAQSLPATPEAEEEPPPGSPPPGQ